MQLDYQKSGRVDLGSARRIFEQTFMVHSSDIDLLVEIYNREASFAY